MVHREWIRIERRRKPQLVELMEFIFGLGLKEGWGVELPRSSSLKARQDRFCCHPSKALVRSGLLKLFPCYGERNTSKNSNMAKRAGFFE